MTQYLLAIYHPDNYDNSREDAQMHRDIDQLNAEMVAAGARVFVGGLRPVQEALSVHAGPSGEMQVHQGPHGPAGEHIGGLWILEAASPEDALAWAQKAATACRVPAEVRPFYGS